MSPWSHQSFSLTHIIVSGSMEAVEKEIKGLISRLLPRKDREGNGTPLQYSCLENPMDRGAWWATVHGVARSLTILSDFTFTFHFSLSRIEEGNGNPLQCSCLENPRDGGAWWAAVYGVAQSQTLLKRPMCAAAHIGCSWYRMLWGWSEMGHTVQSWAAADKIGAPPRRPESPCEGCCVPQHLNAERTRTALRWYPPTATFN